MLVALSGAQGSGKTTVLNNLKTLGFNIVERKTARSILSEWNTTLDAVYRDPVMTVKFQNECLIRKQADEAEAVASDQLWFTERSYADVFTYTVLTIGRYNEYDAWLNSYFDSCKTLQARYLAVYYFEGGAFKTEDDGVRGFNQHYVRLVDETLFSTIDLMIKTNVNTSKQEPPIFQVKKHIVAIDDRTRDVAQRCQELWLANRLPYQIPSYGTRPSSGIMSTEERI